MKKISLNFFGEKATIDLPSSLSSLRYSIVDQFFFDPADVAELVISYVKDFTKTIIQTDLDYKKIVSFGIKELNLDISENSRLYQEKKQNAFVEDSKQLEELEEMRKQGEALKEEKKRMFRDGKAELDKIKAAIKELRIKHKKVYHEVDEAIKNKTKIIEENEKKIEEMETKLKIPHQEKKIEQEPLMNFREMKFCKFVKQFKNAKMPKMGSQHKHWHHKKQAQAKQEKANEENQTQSKPKHPCLFRNNIAKKMEAMKDFVCFNTKDLTGKIFDKFQHMTFNVDLKKEEVAEEKVEAKKEVVEQKDIVHPHVFCDGCHMFPLRGIRYKCACCRNFDYCAECEEKFSAIHEHPFVCIRNPQMKFSKMQLQNVIDKDLPPFDRRIHE